MLHTPPLRQSATEGAHPGGPGMDVRVTGARGGECSMYIYADLGVSFSAGSPD